MLGGCTEQIDIRLINLVNDLCRGWAINNAVLFLLGDGLSAASCEYEGERSKLKAGLSWCRSGILPSETLFPKHLIVSNNQQGLFSVNKISFVKDT